MPPFQNFTPGSKYARSAVKAPKSEQKKERYLSILERVLQTRRREGGAKGQKKRETPRLTKRAWTATHADKTTLTRPQKQNRHHGEAHSASVP